MANLNDKDVVVRLLPAPKANLPVNVTTWLAGKPFYRVHSAEFSATQFNPGKGNARFSPMSNGVPTLYGGATTGVAVMETLFHDLPHDSWGVPYDLSRLHGAVHSVVKPCIDLLLADLNPRTLRKMGVTRSQLLDSDATQYIFTREYAVAIYQSHPDIHGLQWSSKQHGDIALMIFGDRLHSGQLVVETESERITGSDQVMDAIEQEADLLGIVLVNVGGRDSF